MSAASESQRTSASSCRADRAASSSARRVLPVPPGPVSVSRRPPAARSSSDRISSRSRPTKVVALLGGSPASRRRRSRRVPGLLREHARTHRSPDSARPGASRAQARTRRPAARAATPRARAVRRGGERRAMRLRGRERTAAAPRTQQTRGRRIRIGRMQPMLRHPRSAPERGTRPSRPGLRGRAAEGASIIAPVRAGRSRRR